jgi:hypothetical protein
MSEVPPEPTGSPEEGLVPVIEPVPGSPEFIQRYAGLACEEMARAMSARIEGRGEYNPDIYSSDQIVTRAAAIFYTQGPKPHGAEAAPSRSLKVHTHPPTRNIEDSREYTHSSTSPWVTVQRGMSFPDANLTGDELKFLQDAVEEVRRMAGADDNGDL